MAVPPRVKPAAQLQHAPSGNKGSSNPESSLLFSLDVEDAPPSKGLERMPSVASGPATSTAALVDTLQLLLAPASDGEAMVSIAGSDRGALACAQGCCAIRPTCQAQPLSSAVLPVLHSTGAHNTAHI